MVESKPTRYRALLAYDGSNYQGFQRQYKGLATIQDALETAIARVTQQDVIVSGAGRTDTGVHATGQVIAFDVVWRHQDNDLLKAINACLPDDIALQAICQHAGFHPRFDARSRTYCYRVIQAKQPQPLLRMTTWRVYQQIDIPVMQQATRLLIGEHDFGAFGQPPQGSNNTIRVVFHADWTVETAPFGLMLIFKIQATAYLNHMVRRIVGSLVDVGRGFLTMDEFITIFESRDLSRIPTIAPPQGLTLVDVAYAE